MTDVLFDLDGTLTDPAPGITRCLEHALLAMGRQAPSRERLLRFIGPPLQTTFRTLLGTDEPAMIDAAVAHYRERFASVGLYENSVYAGVPTGLGTLRDAGHRLWVVTSKPRIFAQRIAEHFGLAPLFRGVHGSELSGAYADKRDLVARVLEDERLDPANVWMVGDRAADVAGGRANGTRTIGVLWGYGSRAELVDARPDAIVDSMDALAARVLGLGARRRSDAGGGAA